MFDEINDIEWSPLCSTLFASVAKDGRLELWDLKKMNMLLELNFRRLFMNINFSFKKLL